MSEVRIDSKRIKEMYDNPLGKCGHVKEALAALFPDAVKDDKSIDLSKAGGVACRFLHSTEACNKIMEAFGGYEIGGVAIQIRRGEGPYSGKSFYLSNEFNWEIVIDDGSKCLVPTRRK